MPGGVGGASVRKLNYLTDHLPDWCAFNYFFFAESNYSPPCYTHKLLPIAFLQSMKKLMDWFIKLFTVVKVQNIV